MKSFSQEQGQRCPCFVDGDKGVLCRQPALPVPFPACVLLFIGCHEEMRHLCLQLHQALLLRALQTPAQVGGCVCVGQGGGMGTTLQLLPFLTEWTKHRTSSKPSSSSHPSESHPGVCSFVIVLHDCFVFFILFLFFFFPGSCFKLK